MDSVYEVVTFLEKFWLESIGFLTEIFKTQDLGFANISLLEFFGVFGLTTFLTVAVVKWILA